MSSPTDANNADAVDHHVVDVAIAASSEEEEPNNNNNNNMNTTTKDDDDDSTSAKPCSRYFSLRLASNIIFVMASCLYVTLAVMDFDYTKSIQGLSDDILLADDDYTWYEAGFVDDDYVFAARNRNGEDVWVSTYQMIYFAAAMLFVWTGILDFVQESNWMSIVMICAGCFGVVSAMFTLKNVRMSNIFNSISVHLFMVEAIGLFFSHRHRANASKQQQQLTARLQCFIRLGDVSWVVGTLTDVVLSYYFIFETNGVPHAKASVFAAALWLTCSVIYITATCIGECQVRKRNKQQRERHRQADVDSKAMKVTTRQSSTLSASEESNQDLA